MSTPPPAPIPSGWHPDPTGKHDERFFDGRSWTDQAKDGKRFTSDATGLETANAGLTPFVAKSEALPWYKRPMILTPIALIAVLALGGWRIFD